jgi:hypothetical protein
MAGLNEENGGDDETAQTTAKPLFGYFLFYFYSFISLIQILL